MVFYSTQIISRQGPLRLIWVAAHMERQLKRQQVAATSISSSVETLLSDQVPLALRLSGQLLFGLVRIYRRQLDYLQRDCEAVLQRVNTSREGKDNTTGLLGLKRQRQDDKQQQQHGVSGTAAAAGVAAEGTRKSKRSKVGQQQEVSKASDPIVSDSFAFANVDIQDAFDIMTQAEWGGFQGLAAAAPQSKPQGSGQHGSSGGLSFPAPVSSHNVRGSGGFAAVAGAGFSGAALGEDPEVFEDFGDEGSGLGFDLTELDVATLRSNSTAAAGEVDTASDGAQQVATAAAVDQNALGLVEQLSEPLLATQLLMLPDETADGVDTRADTISDSQQELHEDKINMKKLCADEQDPLGNDPFDFEGSMRDSQLTLEEQQQQQHQLATEPPAARKDLKPTAAAAQAEVTPPAAGAACVLSATKLFNRGGRRRFLNQPALPFQGLFNLAAPAAAAVAAAAAADDDYDSGAATKLPSAAGGAVSSRAILGVEMRKEQHTGPGAYIALVGGLQRVQIDNDARQNRVPTELPGAQIKRLLADRTPLLNKARSACSNSSTGKLQLGGKLQLLSNTLPLCSPLEALSAAAVSGGKFSIRPGQWDAAAAAALQQLAATHGVDEQMSHSSIQQLLHGSTVAAMAAAAAAAAPPSPAVLAAQDVYILQATPPNAVVSMLGGSDGSAGCQSAVCARLAAAAPGVLVSSELAGWLVERLGIMLQSVTAAASAEDMQASRHVCHLAGPSAGQEYKQQQQQQQVSKGVDDTYCDATQPLLATQPYDADDVHKGHQLGGHLTGHEPGSTADFLQQMLQSQQDNILQGGDSRADGVTDLLLGEGEDEQTTVHFQDGAISNGVDAAAGFTKYTRKVLERLQQMIASNSPAAVDASSASATAGSKRKQPQAGHNSTNNVTNSSLPAHGSISFAALLQTTSAAVSNARTGKPATSSNSSKCKRIDASRAFYEVLVLQNRGYVGLQQESPYGEVMISPTDKLLQRLQQ